MPHIIEDNSLAKKKKAKKSTALTLPSNNSRAMKNRTIRREATREAIKNMNLITSISKDLSELKTLDSDVKKINVKAHGKGNVIFPAEVDIARVEVAKIKVRADIIATKINSKFRLLAKTLPDLKAIQLTDEDGNDLVKDFMDAVAHGPNR